MINNIRKHKLNEKYDKDISRAIVIHYSVLLSKNIFNSLNPTTESFTLFTNYVALFIILISYVHLFLKHYKNFYLKRIQIVILLSIISLIALTYLYDNRMFTYSWLLSDFKDFIVYSVPLLIFLPQIKNHKYLLEYFYIASYFMFVVIILSAVISTQTVVNQNVYTSYSMAFGRNAVFPALFLYSKYNRDKKIYDLLAFIVSSIIIIFNGSRFPILILLFFIIVKYLYKASKRRIIVVLLVAMICTFVVINFGQTIAWQFYETLLSFNINSRTLFIFSQGLGASDTGRTEIHSALIHHINKSPVIGYGIGSSNRILSNGLAHGFFIDVFATFGYIGGGMILTLVTYLLYKALKYGEGTSRLELLLISLALYVPISTIQLSFLTANMFWFSICLIRKEDIR